METLRKYDGDVNDLGKAELFFLKLMVIPDLRERLQAFVHKREFATKMQDIQADIEIVDSAMNELKDSTRFKKIIEVSQYYNTIHYNELMNLAVCIGIRKSHECGLPWRSIQRLQDKLNCTST